MFQEKHAKKEQREKNKEIKKNKASLNANITKEMFEKVIQLMCFTSGSESLKHVILNPIPIVTYLSIMLFLVQNFHI